MLSHRMVGVSVHLNHISENNDCNQLSYALVEAKDLYSLSALDLITTNCFLNDQDIQLLPK